MDRLFFPPPSNANQRSICLSAFRLRWIDGHVLHSAYAAHPLRRPVVLRFDFLPITNVAHGLLAGLRNPQVAASLLIALLQIERNNQVFAQP